MVANTTTTFLDVAIIGAGWYGLTAAKTYLRLEPQTNLAIFDGDNSVGGVWSKERIYPNLVAQVAHGFFHYPGRPMPKDGETQHHLVTGEMIQHYLEDFARDHDLIRRIRFNSWVQKAERCPRGWRLLVNGNIFETTKLILATGVTSIPNVPHFGVEEGGVPVVHSRDIAANVPAMKSKSVESVVVVGAAKSAYDAAYLFCSMGKRVTWIIRPDGSGPMPIMPAEIFGLNTITLGSTRLMNYMSPSLFNNKGPLAAFFYRTQLGRWLTNAHWRYITHLADKAAGFGEDAGVVNPLKPEIPDRSCFWCDSSLGLITLGDFWSTLKNGNLRIVRDNVESVGQSKVLLESGERIECDYVVSCTGWGDHFSIFTPELKEELGIPRYGPDNPGQPEKSDSWERHDSAAEEKVEKSLPLLAGGPDYKNWHPRRTQTQRRWRLYNRCVPISNARADDHSLVILGQIHTTQTPTVAEIQSFWSILYLLGEVDLPREDAMVKEIAEWNAWTRKRYSSVGERYPYALFDWIPYLDKLLGEAGIKSRRKGNYISELFTPYGPHCYDGYLDEYMAHRARRNSMVKSKVPDTVTTSSGSESDICVK